MAAAKHATTEVMLETMFSTWSVQRSYMEDNWSNGVSSVWESVMKEAAGREPPFREQLSI
jgi:hypothetical protein